MNEYLAAVLAAWNQGAARSQIPGSDLLPYLGQKVVPGAPLAFVGFNPSCRYSTLAKYWQDVHQEMMPASALNGSPDNFAPAWLERVRKVDVHATAAYRTYYAPLENAAAFLKQSSWTAMDVLPLRVTRQAQLKAHFPVDGALELFARSLVDVFPLLLRAANPRVAIVANAHASRFLEARFGLKRTGVRTFYGSPDFPDTIFLLSGMLSGQASLDVYSRERLLADAQVALNA